VAVSEVLMGIFKHGFCEGRIDPVYRVWQMMIQRCHNKKSKDFYLYGARGISVCKRWRNPPIGFVNFMQDMGPRPRGCSVERKNSKGDYKPSNCRWATPREQNRNTAQNVMISWEGKTKCVADWAEDLRINRFIIYHRIHAGWPIERLLIQPKKRLRKKSKTHL
jgi:hypothetical protein